MSNTPQTIIAKPAYQYIPLPSKSSFRVLELLPGEPGSIIHFKLKDSDWNVITNYEAVSYAWGDPEDTLECLCSQQSFKITGGLHDALDHFRFKDKPRYFVGRCCMYQPI